MRRARSVFYLIVGSAIATLAFGGCGPSGSDMNGTGGHVGSGGRVGTGGSAETGGTTGSKGTGGATSGTGGRSAGTGGSSGGTGGTTAGTGGGAPGTGGNVGTGGAGTGGSIGTGGSNPGSGGSATGGGGHPAGAGGTGAGGTGATGSGGSANPGTGGSGVTAGMSAGCGKAPTLASSSYNNGKPISITAANMMRRYILSVPANYDDTRPYKLVIAFHQRDGNDIQMYSQGYYGLQPLADNTTIFVAPNGQLNNAPCSGTGNGQTSCGWPNPNNTDFALADAVVAQVEQNFCVDTNRIFATGWSYGGAMSYETSCARPLGGGSMDYVRAIAVYSGSPSITAGPCPPSKPVAYYASHGTQDNVLPYSGGVTMAQNYAKANGCTWVTPTMVTSGNHICANMMGCMTGYPVEFCSFNGPHTPTPTDPGQNKSWEAQNVWTFFSQF